MKRFSKTVVRPLGFVCLWLAASSAEAVAPRAYVSVSGNDANTCSNPATPCRTFVGAITQTTPGGEVVVLDSGTFGGGTITQAVTINAPAGVVAIAATPIVVNPGSGNTVVLRGLTSQSPTSGSSTGLYHQSGRLFVENVVVDGWFDGIVSGPAGEGLFVKGSIVRNSGFTGLQVSVGNTALVTIDGSFFEANLAFGVILAGGTGRVSNSVMSGNGIGGISNAAGVEVIFQRCEVSNNSTGLRAAQGGIVRVSQSTITRNGTGLLNSSSTLESFGNNVVKGNTMETSGTIAPAALQ